MSAAEIAFDIPLHRTFHYSVPRELIDRVRPGVRVAAPFGGQRLTGVVWRLSPPPEGVPLKAIDSVVDPEPLLTDELLDLAGWISRRWCAPIGEALRSVFPAHVRRVAERTRAARPTAPVEIPVRQPTGDQARVIGELGARLAERRFGVSLLLGVPASGKTEIYLRLLIDAVKDGGQALFMVPEIALTVPFLQEFQARLGLPIVTWHSRASLADKRRGWFGLASGERRMALGARSACLLPFKDLRLVVIDEEQDESFKQEGSPPYYHARDVALERAKRHGALVVLGSATPSLETYAHALTGDYKLHRLDRRISAQAFPTVEVLDRKTGPRDFLLPPLAAKVKEKLEKREQAILLVNRRGFANVALCRKCGWMAQCRSCGVSLIFHRAGAQALKCHHCDFAAALPEACPKCRQPVLELRGGGTQRVESLVGSGLPEARVLRMDRDSFKGANRQGAELYNRFKDMEADVLVGTKMVSKGFHFPEVTLVGIVDADTFLHFPDFRAAERTFQMLYQAAARAGRAEKPGEVIMQTFHPDHYAIEAVTRGDFEAFAKQELQFRKELAYPPYSFLIRVLVTSAKEKSAASAAEELGAKLRAAISSNAEEVLGPSVAFYHRLQGQHRYHLLVKLKAKPLIEEWLARLSGLTPPSGVKYRVNVDPVDLM